MVTLLLLQLLRYVFIFVETRRLTKARPVHYDVPDTCIPNDEAPTTHCDPDTGVVSDEAGIGDPLQKGAALLAIRLLGRVGGRHGGEGIPRAVEQSLGR